MDYTTLALVRQNTPEGGFSSTDYDNTISSFITVASRLIDAYLGVEPNFFAPSSDDQTRYFDGNGEREIQIDRAVSITTVAVAESGGVNSTDYITWYTSDNDYYVKPYNYAAINQPIKWLVVDYNGDKGTFIALPKAVQVTGRFGYSDTTPELVAKACEAQTTQWLMRGKQAWQNQGANDNMLTDAGGKLSDDVKMMLLPIWLELQA